jgi:hypothetical protein
MPAPSIFTLLCSPQFSQLAIAFCGPFLLVLFRPLELILRLLHESKWVTGHYASLLSLLAAGILITPDVFVLEVI